MDRFLKLPENEKVLAFQKADGQTGLSEELIEKDFWVCWILKELFNFDEIKDHLTFKGGTSLSKIFKIISRFSEDIDVSVERSYLGFIDEREPANVSGKKAKKLINELSESCQKFVKTKLFEKLNKTISSKVGKDSNWKLEIDKEDNDGQTILFYYPKVTSKNSGYIRPVVKIELGARSDHWPAGMKTISPYVSEILPDSLKDMEASIRVLNIERTFWEKATILHKYAHYPKDKIVPERQSRHYYDFYCLLQSNGKDMALSNIELLEKVTKHKTLYFRSGWANYNTAKKGSLKTIPQKIILDAMEKDYLAMKEMFFNDIPSWDKIVNALKSFENEFNNNG